jgi:hypothetical protein
MSLDEWFTPLNIALAVLALGVSCAVALAIQNKGRQQREIGRIQLPAATPGHGTEIVVFVVTDRRGQPRVMFRTTHASPWSRGVAWSARWRSAGSSSKPARAPVAEARLARSVADKLVCTERVGDLLCVTGFRYLLGQDLTLSFPTLGKVCITPGVPSLPEPRRPAKVGA